jgi:hypothetical protein
MATTGSEKVDNMVEVLRQWQSIERQSMAVTSEIMAQTESPLIRMIMQIIAHDSMMHHRVQQFLIDSVTRESVSLSREELGEIWERIEAHDQAEKKTIEMAKSLREQAWSPVHKQLLDYLLADESKHDTLLEQLTEVKKEMTRASGA